MDSAPPSARGDLGAVLGTSIVIPQATPPAFEEMKAAVAKRESVSAYCLLVNVWRRGRLVAGDRVISSSNRAA